MEISILANIVLTGLLITHFVYHFTKMAQMKKKLNQNQRQVREEVEKEYQEKLKEIDKRVKIINDELDSINNNVLTPVLRPNHRI